MVGDRRISRMAVLGSVAAVLGGILCIRLWFLQAVDSPGLEERVREEAAVTASGRRVRVWRM